MFAEPCSRVNSLPVDEYAVDLVFDLRPQKATWMARGHLSALQQRLPLSIVWWWTVFPFVLAQLCRFTPQCRELAP